MNDMINTLENLKDELNKELLSTAQSVCRIGYLLKLARDTRILDGTYKDVYEFASSEFGLDKSQVSRFMNINDRWSIGGNSEELLPEYSQYGSSKLSIMLTLPDEINEELSPEMTKADIQAVKDEYDEEQKITPIEHMAEDTSEVPDDFIQAVVKELNDEHSEPAELINEVYTGPEINYKDDVMESYMPVGDKTYIINIPGQGHHMIKCTEDQLMITRMSDGNKTPLSWEDFTAAVVDDVKNREFKEEKPKEKTKPKKVEKSKKPEKTPSETKTAPTACQPAEPVDVWEEEPKEAAGETKVKKEAEDPWVEESTETSAEEATTEAAGDEANEAAGDQDINPPEIPNEAAGEITALRKQVADKLDQVKDEVINGESWEIIRDHVRDISKFITVSAF